MSEVNKNSALEAFDFICGANDIDGAWQEEKQKIRAALSTNSDLLGALTKIKGIMSRCYGQQVAVPYGAIEQIYNEAIAKSNGA